MSRILVVYGTSDGHTAKIAEAIGETLRRKGAIVNVMDARRAIGRPESYDGIVVAASVHAGGYQRSVHRWVREHAASLQRKPTAFVSVCLAVLQNKTEVQQHLTAILDQFFADAGWRPTLTKIVAGALLYTRYHWLTRWMMKRIVQKAGGDTDTSRDYEYTDWKDVRKFAVEFGQLVDRTSAAIVPPSSDARVA